MYIFRLLLSRSRWYLCMYDSHKCMLIFLHKKGSKKNCEKQSLLFFPRFQLNFFQKFFKHVLQWINPLLKKAQILLIPFWRILIEYLCTQFYFNFNKEINIIYHFRSDYCYSRENHFSQILNLKRISYPFRKILYSVPDFF